MDIRGQFFWGVIHGCKAFSVWEIEDNQNRKSTTDFHYIMINGCLVNLSPFRDTFQEGAWLIFSFGNRWVPIHTRRSTAVEVNFHCCELPSPGERIHQRFVKKRKGKGARIARSLEVNVIS